MLGYVLAVSAGCCVGFLAAGAAASIKIVGHEERLAELERLLGIQTSLIRDLSESLKAVMGALDNRVSNSIGTVDVSRAQNALARYEALASELEAGAREADASAHEAVKA